MGYVVTLNVIKNARKPFKIKTLIINILAPETLYFKTISFAFLGIIFRSKKGQELFYDQNVQNGFD